MLAFDIDLVANDIARFIKTVRLQYPDIRFMLFINAKHPHALIAD
jgi:hypothetical protein